MVASRALRFGDELNASSLREMAWPQDSLPAGAFGKIADVTSAKRVVLMPIDVNEAVLGNKITGPGQRATLSAMLGEGMKAVTVRGQRCRRRRRLRAAGRSCRRAVDTARRENLALTDVVVSDVRVLAIDQLADQRAEKPSVAKAVTLEVNITDGQKIALAGTVGSLSLLLSKAGEATSGDVRRVTSGDLGKPSEPAPNSRFVNIAVNRPSKNLRTEYTVPTEHSDAQAQLAQPAPIRN